MCQSVLQAALNRSRFYLRLLIICIAFPVSAMSALASSSCLPPGRRVAAVEMDRFIKDSAGVLVDTSGDVVKLGGRIANYVATDPGVLNKMRALMQRANVRQRTAIGAALMTASDLCSLSQPSAREAIQKYVRNLGDDYVLAGFVGDARSGAPVSGMAAGPAKPGGLGFGLWDGEFSTDLKDPFAPILVPR